MVGLQTLDLPIEVQILCPQPVGQSTLHKQQGAFPISNPLTAFAKRSAPDEYNDDREGARCRGTFCEELSK